MTETLSFIKHHLYSMLVDLAETSGLACLMDITRESRLFNGSRESVRVDVLGSQP